jgi:hypothetical protein
LGCWGIRSPFPLVTGHAHIAEIFRNIQPTAGGIEVVLTFRLLEFGEIIIAICGAVVGVCKLPIRAEIADCHVEEEIRMALRKRHTKLSR